MHRRREGKYIQKKNYEEFYKHRNVHPPRTKNNKRGNRVQEHHPTRNNKQDKSRRKKHTGHRKVAYKGSQQAWGRKGRKPHKFQNPAEAETRRIVDSMGEQSGTGDEGIYRYGTAWQKVPDPKRRLQKAQVHGTDPKSTMGLGTYNTV
jgi:hypothetical protein